MVRGLLRDQETVADPSRPPRVPKVAQGAIVLFCTLAPAIVCQLNLPEPTDRHIHVESFRYGKSPAVIRCNRGDRLHLTFSSRDTAHSFFLAEMDHDVKVAPGADTVSVFGVRDPTAPPRRVRTVTLTAQHPGWLRYVVSKSHFRCHVWCGPLHAFEHGTLIIGPNVLLHGAFGALIGIILASLLGVAFGWAPTRAAPPVDLLARFPNLASILRRRSFQFWASLPVMCLMYITLIATLFGTVVAGRNLGIMLLWVVWLVLLTAVLTPLGGRAWCLVCPVPTAGEALQRGSLTDVRTGRSAGTHNRLFGLGLQWPRVLTNPWPRYLLFLALATMSTALVAHPRVTGWALIVLLVVATVMALIFPLRAFCQHICPVQAFLGLYARAGALAIRSADPDVCASCKVRSCRTGNERGWACPYDLCVADIHDNADCGLCTECLKSCAYENVALQWQGLGRVSPVRNEAEAWQAMGMIVVAAAFCVVHLGPWPEVRDWVDIVDRGYWRAFGLYAAGLWTAALLLFPSVQLGLAYASGRFLQQPVREVLLHVSATWVPLGLALWIAVVTPMLLVNASFVLQSMSDPLGWGWDLLGTAGTPWIPLLPRATPFLQCFVGLVGFGHALRTARRMVLSLNGQRRRVLLVVAGQSALLAAVTGWFLWMFSAT